MTKNHYSQCERCLYYMIIDSGYGYCRRYPPKDYTEKVGWFKKETKTRYQIVEWSRRACGEFIE